MKSSRTPLSLWSIPPTAVLITYQDVSKNYLSLYVSEFHFRYNHWHSKNIVDQAN